MPLEQSPRYIVKKAHVASEDFEGETVLVDFLCGKYYALLGSGGYLWDLLLSGVTVPELIDHAVVTYNVSPTDIEDSIVAFTESLKANRLIIECEDTENTSLPDPSPSGKPFEKPVIEAFDDLQELINLDPVHDTDVEKGWPAKNPGEVLLERK